MQKSAVLTPYIKPDLCNGLYVSHYAEERISLQIIHCSIGLPERLAVNADYTRLTWIFQMFRQTRLKVL